MKVASVSWLVGYKRKVASGAPASGLGKEICLMLLGSWDREGWWILSEEWERERWVLDLWLVG